jgi:hypothetical protein
MVLVMLVAAAFAAGCTQSRDDSAVNTLTLRVKQLEQRVGVAERRSELTMLGQRLSNLEARVVAVEAQKTGAESHDSTPPPETVNRPRDSSSGAVAPSNGVEAASERSRRVKSVAEEDRARVAAIREQSRNNPEPAARRQAMSELRAWRRAQVEALRSRDSASAQTK